MADEATNQDLFTDRRKLSDVHVLSSTAATVLAAAVIGSFSGILWLIIQLPSRLQQLENGIERIATNQERLESRLEWIEGQVRQHETRIIRLEPR